MKELSEQERKIKDAIAFLKRRLHLNEAEILESLQQRLAQAEQDARRIPELEMELAMANDAASKGDLARSLAGGMEMEIDELRNALAADVKDAERYRARFDALRKIANSTSGEE